MTWEFFTQKRARPRPLESVPSEKIDLHALDRSENTAVWFGHSSLFIQVAGQRFLVDPVLTGTVSPVSFTNKSFPGTDPYSIADIPDIDHVLISHDHLDHLNYATMKQLQDRIALVHCGLGGGAHLERWGFSPEQIREHDWHEQSDLGGGIVLHTLPARHFSGRGFVQNKTLWISMLLITPELKIYLSGDSGYGDHFKQIGEQFGPIDWAFLENGQYDLKWKYVHMLPPETLQAALDLQAAYLFPIHNSKFLLANHAWDDLLVQLSRLCEYEEISLVTPLIGEKVALQHNTASYTQWWAGVK